MWYYVEIRKRIFRVFTDKFLCIYSHLYISIRTKGKFKH
jgi:hypothetical protein